MAFPEPQKMAPFLKSCCDQGLYGLVYLDNERTMICIPWPTVPKANEPIPQTFEMFKEWAKLSFIKRGNTAGDAEKEGYSTQKHRFRNALTRADGLRCRDDKSGDGYRVYQLTQQDYNAFSPRGQPCIIQPPNTPQGVMGNPVPVYNESPNMGLSDLLKEIAVEDDFPSDYDLPAISYSNTTQLSLAMKLYYRGDIIWSQGISNMYGFRVYYGNNIPDMSRLLDNGQRSTLENTCRFPNEFYFGPDKFCQIEMPDPTKAAKNEKQLRKTNEIVANMNRGFILLMSHDGDQTSSYPVPNVFGIRLCQTRVFPYECNVANAAELKTTGLQRLQRTQIFDAEEFQRRLNLWLRGQGEMPSATLRFSIGQKPLENNKISSNNLVTLEVVVKSAETILNQNEETCPSGPDQGVLISIGNSMDQEANALGNTVVSAITLKTNG